MLRVVGAAVAVTGTGTSPSTSIRPARESSGVTSAFDCTYHDIVPDERIIYSYVMRIDGRKISVSQASIELFAEEGGTRFVLTEYGDYLDGYDDAGSREHGTNALIDALQKVVEGP